MLIYYNANMATHRRSANIIANEKIMQDAFSLHAAAIARLHSHIDSVGSGSASAGRETFRLLTVLDKTHHELIRAIGPGTGVIATEFLARH
jgi:hypothetical protein